MHGMAGSAALILLTIQQTVTPLEGIIYIATFGLGSILGMATLSIVIAIPLRYSSRSLSWLHHGLQGSIGAVTIAIGLMLFGLLIEFCRLQVSYRAADWVDMLANTLGIMVGLTIAIAGLGGWGPRFEDWFSRRHSH